MVGILSLLSSLPRMAALVTSARVLIPPLAIDWFSLLVSADTLEYVTAAIILSQPLVLKLDERLT